MSAHTVVVTDSTAYLPTGLAQELDILTVPLQVIMDGVAAPEGEGVDGARVSQALERGDVVTTSRPSPGDFDAVYRRAAAQGADEVVSIHLSGDLSGTVEVARSVAREVALETGMQIHVVDSRSIGMGMGFAVEQAARAAVGTSAGTERPGATIARAAEQRCLNSQTFFYVDTLEYLRRGGRIGTARAWLGSALTIKPLLELVDGRLEPMERVRTAERAIARLVEVAAQSLERQPAEVAVHHVAAADRAQEVADRLTAAAPGSDTRVVISEVGGVLGAHVGPGAVGVVLSPLL